MRKKYHNTSEREHHPQISVGLFFIVLGLALLVATNDWLNLGSVGDYFTWETAMIFVGVLLLLNFHLTGGLLLIAGGTWFFLDNHYTGIPENIKTYYWPAVITLLGLGLIIMSMFKNKNRNNQITNN